MSLAEYRNPKPTAVREDAPSFADDIEERLADGALGGALPVGRRGGKPTAALLIGLALIFTVSLFAIFGPLLSPYSWDEVLPGARLQAPSGLHPFGADALGRDLFARVAQGARLAFLMSSLSVGIALGIGLTLGSLAGYFGGPLDSFLSRLIDGWVALPGTLLALVLVARLGSSLENLILALGLMGVPSFFRLVRNATLATSVLPYVESAVALGASHNRIMWRHVFPNIAPSVIVLTSSRLGLMLLTGSALSFVGLGAQAPLPEWGAMLAGARVYLETAPWLWLYPGVAMTLTVIGFNLLGDGLRDWLDRS